MLLEPTPENLRVEIARRNTPRTEIARAGGINPKMFSAYLAELRTFNPDARARVALMVNRFFGEKIFDETLPEFGDRRWSVSGDMGARKKNLPELTSL